LTKRSLSCSGCRCGWLRTSPEINQLHPLSLNLIKYLHKGIFQKPPLPSFISSILSTEFAIEVTVCLNSLINYSNCYWVNYSRLILSNFSLNVNNGFISNVEFPLEYFFSFGIVN
jgi:hypothetical protein